MPAALPEDEAAHLRLKRATLMASHCLPRAEPKRQQTSVVTMTVTANTPNGIAMDSRVTRLLCWYWGFKLQVISQIPAHVKWGTLCNSSNGPLQCLNAHLCCGSTARHMSLGSSSQKRKQLKGAQEVHFAGLQSAKKIFWQGKSKQRQAMEATNAARKHIPRPSLENSLCDEADKINTSDARCTCIVNVCIEKVSPPCLYRRGLVF